MMTALTDWSLWGAFLAGGIVGTITTMTVLVALIAAQDAEYAHQANQIASYDVTHDPDEVVRVIGEFPPVTDYLPVDEVTDGP